MKAWVIAFCLMGQQGSADCLILRDFVLSVEAEVGLIERPDGWTVVFEPDGRAPSELTLISIQRVPDPADGPVLPQSEVLGNGWTLRYAFEVDEAVGSGGAETRLSGWIDSTPPLAVSCTAQAEHPNAEWCVPILGSLRPKAEGCGTGGN
jgi:hypothetical protein